MRYTKLTLENFRNYYGKHEIKFPDKKGIFLIHALNGAGKSAIYHAFNYVFFGESKQQTAERNKVKLIDFISIDAAKEKKFNCSVRIEFTNDGIPYELTRRHQSTTSSTVKPTEDNHFKESLSLIKDGDVIEEKNIPYEIEDIARKEISDFFLVDNEFIGDLNEALKGANSEAIREAIDRTIGVSIFEQGQRDISALNMKYAKQLNTEIKKEKENTKLSQEFVQREELYNSSEKSLEILKKEKISIDKNVEKLTIKRNNYKDQEKSIGDLENLENEISETIKNKENNFEKIQSLIVEEWFMPTQSRAEEVLKTQKRIVENEIKKTTELDNKKKTVKELKNALKHTKCHACKQDLPKNIIKKWETELKKEETYLKKLEDNKGDHHNVAPHPKEVIHYTKVNKKLLEELEKNHFELITNITRLKRKHKSLSTKVQKGDNAVIRETQKQLEESLYQQKNIITDIKKQENIVSINNKLLVETKRKLAKNVSSSSSLSGIVDIADNLSGLLEKAYNDFRDEARKGVSIFTTVAFKQLINKKNVDIDIDEDYVVKLTTTKGEKAGGESMGQSRIIAMALIAGLNKSSVINAPILVDSPMVGLDKIHMENLYAFFPELSEQVILLVPPGEWNEDLHRKKVNKNIAGEVTIENKDATLASLHEGYEEKYLQE